MWCLFPGCSTPWSGIYTLGPKSKLPSICAGKLSAPNGQARPWRTALGCAAQVGLTPKDVQLRIMGGTIQIAASLQTNQIAAGALGPPVSFQIERAGFRSLATTVDQPYQNVGLVIRKSRMEELAPRLVPLLRAVRSGIYRFYSAKPFTLKVIPKYTKDSDPDIIERTYEFYRKAGFKRELMISEPGMQGILDFMSETVPEAKKATPGQFFDDRFVRQLNSAKQ